MRGRTVISLVVVGLTSTLWASPFGRFGRDHQDGLLTLNVSTTGFRTPPTCGEIAVTWPDPGPATAKALSSRGKTVLFKNARPGAPISYRLDLPYPGFEARFRRHAEFVLSSRESGGRLRTEIHNGYAVVRRTDAPAPMLVFYVPSGSRLRAQGSRLTIDRSGQFAVRICTPLGIRDLRTTEDGSKAIAFWRSRAFPGGNEDWCAAPPVLTVAQRALGYPAKIANRPFGGMPELLTKYGELKLYHGSRLRLALPRPNIEPLRYEAPAHPDPTRLRQLNELASDLNMSWAQNAVDLGYSRWVPALQSWPFLDEENRARLRTIFRLNLPHAFDLPPYAANAAKRPWHRETEPLSGEPYFWTYFIDGPGGRKYDIEWGIGLPVYGLYNYSLYTQDWTLAKRLWPDVKRALRYFDLAWDWAWMTVVNADHGYSTGTGDPINAAYVGLVGAVKMAEKLGDLAAARHYREMLQQMAVPMIARFVMTDYGRQHGLIGPQSLAVGFSELEGFTRVQLGKEDPWGATTLLSGNGCQPEIRRLYQTYASKAMETFFHRYDSAYPRWFDGTVKYPFETTYDGNSGYVAFPQVYFRSASAGQKWAWIDQFLSNRTHAWVGANVLADLLAKPH